MTILDDSGVGFLEDSQNHRTSSLPGHVEPLSIT